MALVTSPRPSTPVPDPSRKGSVGVVETRYADLPHPLQLDCGRELGPVRIAYETYGTLSPAKDNVILVCHALSGDAHAAGWAASPETPTALDGFRADDRGVKPRSGLGWWDGMIGPGKAFDTDQYYVVSTNLVGGCRGSTGPSSVNPATGQPYGTDFPVITVGDMVRAERALLDMLGIERVFAVSGGSLGGMQAIEWSVAYPDQVDAVVPIASTAHLGAQGLAWNAIARNAIMADPDWQQGHYYSTGRAPAAGIGVARMVGHVTYLSAEAMSEKFDRRLQAGPEADYSYSLDQADFEVESYLKYQAKSFAARFDANTYLYLSRALTYFDVARTHGHGSLKEALRKVQARYLLISFTSDWLYPPHDSQEIQAALLANGKDVSYYNIMASYGHDSFLLEEARQTPLIVDFLADTYARVRERA